MLRESFVRGLTALQERGLVYDLLIFPRHLANAEALVARLPEQRFVVDHLAKPFIRDRQIEPWASALRRLARFPNVSCKLSGLVTEADWRAFTREDLLPYLEIALDAFGPERLLFGSDWPVCLVAASYSSVRSVVQGFIERLLAERARRRARRERSSLVRARERAHCAVTPPSNGNAAPVTKDDSSEQR